MKRTIVFLLLVGNKSRLVCAGSSAGYRCGRIWPTDPDRMAEIPKDGREVWQEATESHEEKRQGPTESRQAGSQESKPPRGLAFRINSKLNI